MVFGNKTAGHESTKPGSGRQISVLPRTFEISKRKYAANSGTPGHTSLLMQRDRRQKRCRLPVCSAYQIFVAYFRIRALDKVFFTRCDYPPPCYRQVNRTMITLADIAFATSRACHFFNAADLSYAALRTPKL